MSKFKVGDEVKIVNLAQFGGSEPNMYNVRRGDKGKVVGYYKKCENFAIVENPKFKRSHAGEGKVYVPFAHLELFGGYDQSNRSKLREHIKSLGFSAIDLSVAAGFNKAYFGSETGESRFNSRGDISDDRLLELKHNAFSAMMKLKIEKSGYRNGGYVERKITPSDFCLHGSQSKIHLAKQNSKTPKILKRIEKPKSKWVVSNKVFLTFVFFFVLLILLAVTGIIKQVF